MKKNPEELLQLSARKDPRAFKQLYDQTSGKLFSLVMQFVQEQCLAEEVLQEVYLQIWLRAETYDSGKSSATTWMYAIARNKSLDKLRALKVRPNTVSFEQDASIFISEAATPEQQASMREELGNIVKSLKGMKARQKECILLACYYGHTHDELAKRYQLPLGTVKAWIRRGKQQIAGLSAQTTAVSRIATS